MHLRACRNARIDRGPACLPACAGAASGQAQQGAPTLSISCMHANSDSAPSFSKDDAVAKARQQHVKKSLSQKQHPEQCACAACMRAPVRPVSSSTVNKHSRGGSLALGGMSSRASAVATPATRAAVQRIRKCTSMDAPTVGPGWLACCQLETLLPEKRLHIQVQRNFPKKDPKKELKRNSKGTPNVACARATLPLHVSTNALTPLHCTGHALCTRSGARCAHAACCSHAALWP